VIRLAAGLLMLAGCAEIRTPPPAPPPVALAPGTAAPVPAMIAAAAADFADRGLRLTDRPAAAALAAARLEWLAGAAAARDPRLAPLGAGIAQELALARTEMRDALGTAEAAAPGPTVRALLGAAGGLETGDPARAAAALQAPDFLPGGAESIRRLAALGPLPQAALATQRTAEALARLQASGGLNIAAPRTADSFDRTTFGLGGVGPDGAAF